MLKALEFIQKQLIRVFITKLFPQIIFLLHLVNRTKIQRATIMIRKLLSAIIVLISIVSAHQVQPELINNPTKISINGTLHKLISYSMSGIEYVLFPGDGADTLISEQPYGGSTLKSTMIFHYEEDNLMEITSGYFLDTVWTLSTKFEYTYNSSNQVLTNTTNSYDNTGAVISATKKEYDYKNNLPYKFTNYSSYSDTSGPSSITKYEYPNLMEYVEYEAGDMSKPDSFNYKRHHIYKTTDIADSTISYSKNNGVWEQSGINYYPTEFSGDKVSKTYSNSVSIDGGVFTQNKNGVTSYTYAGDTVYVEMKAFPYFISDTTIINYVYLNTGESTIGISENKIVNTNNNFKARVSKNIINVNFKNDFSGEITLTLTDLKGRICRKSVISRNIGSNISMDLTGIAKGHYLLSVDNKKGAGVVKIFYK